MATEADYTLDKGDGGRTVLRLKGPYLLSTIANVDRGLRKLDETNAWAIENWERLHAALEGTPHLVRSFSSADQSTNGYSYVVRVDPAYARGRGVSLPGLSDAIGAALGAEGTPFYRANWLLPAHGVFQAKNAFGKGAPWTHYAREDIDYSLGQWPVAQDGIETSLSNLNLHRPPNRAEQIDALAGAIRKVFENLDDVAVA